LIFWVDAQLPPALAPWLTETFGVAAKSARFLGLADAEDEHIFSLARESGNVVIVSKDSDFVEMALRSGPPPKILWVTCGNLTNRRLQMVFAQTFPDAMKLLDAGETIVEIGDEA
jgi:predicted nuclease of predicted toxin-antitoxin system